MSVVAMAVAAGMTGMSAAVEAMAVAATTAATTAAVAVGTTTATTTVVVATTATTTVATTETGATSVTIVDTTGETTTAAEVVMTVVAMTAAVMMTVDGAVFLSGAVSDPATLATLTAATVTAAVAGSATRRRWKDGMGGGSGGMRSGPRLRVAARCRELVLLDKPRHANLRVGKGSVNTWRRSPLQLFNPVGVLGCGVMETPSNQLPGPASPESRVSKVRGTGSSFSPAF
mmetsp:Transcript_2826/g.5884  ORF Transcript_2826/g.5884 Transcript_2826/m.5884 type:complete len:231 (+) Transcript_2826:400-1092(+)